ncbi:glycosyltransferase family 2 protein [Marinoscillum furvescens]|uniref:Glycosyl transferase family 2 n=1 Tax=Marinoscillum furvescens DSM 4134 TaxID=1122208 RepID=A0A3D9L4G1_MARFU|nr:glycosyltransferase family 2 protein [Marinoscillum furvescens]RED99558.1 glycosyl transferase family 2 [Marinoscillum furvescens DSM 4134]
MHNVQIAPLVSVLIPVYNAASYLNEAVQGILDQSFSNLEVLILDDASTDDSWELIQAFKDPRVKKYRNEVNKGYLKSCNILFNKAIGDYITFQDADDISDTDRIKLQLQAFEQDPELGICGTAIFRIDSEGRKLYAEKKALASDVIKANIATTPQFCGATIMIPRLVLETIGGYKEYYDRIGSEDYDWACRIVEKFKAKNLERPLYYYRQLSNAISKEINPRKMVSGKMVKYFAQQRREYGTDDLLDNKMDQANRKEKEFIQPYERDRSLIYIEYASWFMYNKLYKDAVRSAFMALTIRPFSLRNLRTLLYCIRKSR